jgi:hypothetical protein
LPKLSCGVCINPGPSHSVNFALIRKSLLDYLTPLVVVSPSLIWIALDKSVWTWDPALYGKSSIELLVNLVYAPTDWISQMLDVLGGHALAVSWLAKFLYLSDIYWAQLMQGYWYLYG